MIMQPPTPHHHLTTCFPCVPLFWQSAPIFRVLFMCLFELTWSRSYKIIHQNYILRGASLMSNKQIINAQNPLWTDFSRFWVRNCKWIFTIPTKVQKCLKRKKTLFLWNKQIRNMMKGNDATVNFECREDQYSSRKRYLTWCYHKPNL